MTEWREKKLIKDNYFLGGGGGSTYHQWQTLKFFFLNSLPPPLKRNLKTVKGDADATFDRSIQQEHHPLTMLTITLIGLHSVLEMDVYFPDHSSVAHWRRFTNIRDLETVREACHGWGMISLLRSNRSRDSTALRYGCMSFVNAPVRFVCVLYYSL